MTRMMDVLSELTNLGAVSAPPVSTTELPLPIPAVTEEVTAQEEVVEEVTDETNTQEEVLPEEEPPPVEDSLPKMVALARTHLKQMEDSVSALRDLLDALEARMED